MIPTPSPGKWVFVLDTLVVFANGLIANSEAIKARLKAIEPFTVIGADGGSLLAESLGYVPALIIGDLDSLPDDQRKRFPPDEVQFITAPAEKDETDLELALLHAVSLKPDRIVLLGLLGGRLDMSLANLLLLGHESLAGVLVEVWEDWQTAHPIRPPGAMITGKAGDTLSLIPIGGPAGGISTWGLRYALADEPLSTGPARGLSNVLTGPEVHIALRGGILLAVHTPGRA
jgi:thiamine pyrophosphokinase